MESGGQSGPADARNPHFRIKLAVCPSLPLPVMLLGEIRSHPRAYVATCTQPTETVCSLPPIDFPRFLGSDVVMVCYSSFGR